jgi:cell division GTPase FtsZ
MATAVKRKTSTKRASAKRTKAKAVAQSRKLAATVRRAKKRAASKQAASTKAKASTKSAPKTKSVSQRKSSTKSKTSAKQRAAWKTSRTTTTRQSKPSTSRPPITRPAPSQGLVPTLALEEYEPQTTPQTGVRDTTRGSTKFGWIGAGQCGGRLAKAFCELGYGKVLAVNTAHQDLKDLKLPDSQKLLMDIGRKGAGKDMSRGRDAAIQYRQDIIHAIERIFAENVDHLMVAFGSGGGTGSGSVIPLIETVRSCAKHVGLKNVGRRIGVLATLPTAGEAASPKIGQNSFEVMTQLTKMATEGQISPLIIIDNEKISRLYPGMTVKKFWPTINTTVAGLFDIFNRLSALSSPYTSFDSVDYQSIIESGNCAIMGLSKVDTYRRKYDLSEAMKSNLAKTLLAGGFDLTSAKVAGVIVVGGKKIMANTPGLQDSINHAFDVMTDLTGNATIHRGIYEDERDSVRVYTIIGGLEPPTERLEELRQVF